MLNEVAANIGREAPPVRSKRQEHAVTALVAVIAVSSMKESVVDDGSISSGEVESHLAFVIRHRWVRRIQSGGIVRVSFTGSTACNSTLCKCEPGRTRSAPFRESVSHR
jgi:hypothetical protein